MQQEIILGINGIRLLGYRTGVGRAIEAILRCMGELKHPFSEIRVYTPQALSADIYLPPMARNVVLKSWLPLGLWEQIVLPIAQGSHNLLLCPSYVSPIFAGCPVLLIHHGSYEGYPEAFPLYKRIKSRMIYQLSARSATIISTVSEHSKRDIIKFYGVAPEKISVIPEGVDTKLFFPVSDVERLKEWRKQRLGVDAPFILYVGKPAKRRNLPNVIKAFAQLKKERHIPHKLVLIGAKLPGSSFQEIINSLDLKEEVISIDFASHEEIAVAYNACEMLVYPSSYEGFGMPVLEAMACGTPIIALDNTAFPEFSSGIATLLPDAEPETLSNAMWTLHQDQKWRAKVSRLGPERAQSYDWMLVTEQYIKLMSTLAK